MNHGARAASSGIDLGAHASTRQIRCGPRVGRLMVSVSCEWIALQPNHIAGFQSP